MPDSKPLELLQAAIGRMASNSFVVKGWSITLATLALGLAVKDGGPVFALLGLMPVFFFWLLDAYYLALERSFVRLFETAAAAYGKGDDPGFAMKPSAGGAAGVFGAALSGPVVFVHGPLAAVLFVSFFLLCDAL